MTKRPALGKGLSALIPAARTGTPESRPGVSVQMVDLDHLEANRQQPRRRFDDDGLEELARSIKETGILQPILVTRDADRFRILAGERRVRAARIAGLTRVPVLVKEGLEDRDHLLVALIENIQRRDLTAMEEAESYWHLKEKFGMTQDEIAERVGKDRTTVSNAMRLLKLPAEVRAQVEDGLLSAGHARTLLSLPSAADQETLARAFIRRGLSVRAAEARVQEVLEGAPKKKASGPDNDPDTRDAEQRLQRSLGTKVEIRRRKKGGEVRLSFYSEEQLIGLFERLVGGGG